jgi:hypothetical protein
MYFFYELDIIYAQLQRLISYDITSTIDKTINLKNTP